MPQSLWDMRGAVRNVKANCAEELADQLLNKHIQTIVKKHRWADTLRLGTIIIPDGYSVGVINTTSGSPLISGTGTGWPVNDAVNTTLTAATKDAPGFTDIKVQNLTQIKQGDYLLLDQETSNVTEVVVVSYVGLDRIKALCRYNHASGVSVQKSSLANLQMTLPNNQVATVQAVLANNSLQLDQPFGGPPFVSAPYNIFLRYARLSATAIRILDGVDPISGNVIGTGKTFQWLNWVDPQRTSTSDGSALEFVEMPPNPGGVMQWEIWPAQTSAWVIPVLYVDGWPRLINQNDLSPYFINEEIFIALAQGDALCTKNISERNKQDPYYDPIAGKRFTEEGKEMLDDAVQADSGRYQRMLMSYKEQMRGGGSLAYEASHLPGWPVEPE